MKLVDPTDFEILEVLDETGRNTAKNLSVILQKDRSYINTRLSRLAANELVTRIGPANNSGLYELTARGDVVLDHWVAGGDTDADFEALIEEELDSSVDVSSA